MQKNKSKNNFTEIVITLNYYLSKKKLNKLKDNFTENSCNNTVIIRAYDDMINSRYR
jgi:hypothetical protein